MPEIIISPFCFQGCSSIEITVTGKFDNTISLAGVAIHFRQVFANLLKCY